MISHWLFSASKLPVFSTVVSGTTEEGLHVKGLESGDYFAGQRSTVLERPKTSQSSDWLGGVFYRGSLRQIRLGGKSPL